MPDTERESLLRMLAEQRDFLRFTVKDLDDEQAAQRTTASELTLAGLIKHVTAIEREWIEFIQHGAGEIDYKDPATFEAHAQGFRLTGEETLRSVLADYQRTAEQTEEYVRSLPDLEVAHKLPAAPWFPEDASWTARDVLLHLLRETAQHCGHADIIRESLDGQKTMG